MYVSCVCITTSAIGRERERVRDTHTRGCAAIRPEAFSESILLQVPAVHGKMSPELVRSCESLRAVWPGARVWLLSRVGPHVGLEVIGSRELPLANLALEGTDASVFPAVATQLVGSREPLPAPLVVTDVRFLSGVLPDVHLQVRELQVALGAPRVETHEGFALLLGF